MEGCDVYEGDIVLPRTGSDEPVPGVTPCWTGVEGCDVYDLVGAGCFHTSCYSVLPFDRWLYIGLVFICMDRVQFCIGMFQSDRLPVCHLSVFLIVIQCFIYVVLGVAGFLAGGVEGGPVLLLSGFP